MRIIFAILVTVIIFLIYKFFLALLQQKRNLGRRWYFSVLDYIIFMAVWISYYLIGSELLEYSDWEVFVSLNLIGIFSVIWIHYSIDLEDRKLKPRKASSEERRAKKTIVYSIIFLFVLFHGYQQTLQLFHGGEINGSLLLLNYSVVVVVESLDRLLSQVVKAE